MSLENIEEYLKDVQAIKYYDTVKAENEILKKKIEGAEEMFQLERDKLMVTNSELSLKQDSLSQEVIDLRTEANQKDLKIETLTTELYKTGEEVLKLKERVRELEDLKAAVDGKTLEEAKASFLVVKDEEIKRVAGEQFNKMKADWEESRKPIEVLNAACNLLENSFRTNLWLKELAEKGVPKNIIKIIENEVSSKINEEFNRRVKIESDRKALEKLNQKMSIEWPNWLKMYVGPISKELERKMYENAFGLLKNTWNFACDKCSTPMSVQINEKMISDLLANRFILVECLNPNCRDFIVRHRIKVELERLIFYYLIKGKFEGQVH